MATRWRRPIARIELSVRRAAVLLAWLSCLPAWAACPPLADIIKLPAWQLDPGLPLLAGCLDEPAYLAALGHQLNRRGRYQEASDYLERALMLAPDNTDAAIDYAIALTGIGDTASALSMLDALLDGAELPESLRTALARQRRELASPFTAAGWMRRIRLGLRLGHDDNLLGAPNLSTLALTTASGVLQLPLADSYHARAGSYLRADLELDATLQTGGGQWTVHGAYLQREAPHVGEARYGQAHLAAEYSRYANGPGPYLGASVSSLRHPGGSLYDAEAIHAGIGIPAAAGFLAPCSQRWGGEAQRRSYPANRVLDGRYLGLGAVLSCEGAIRWTASVRIGLDTAADQRPGGNQAQTELRLVGLYPMAYGTLLADLQSGSYRDREGYSALLENGLTRSLRRQSLVAEYQVPLGGDFHGAAGVEWVDQQANLSLFHFSSTGFYLALRKTW